MGLKEDLQAAVEEARKAADEYQARASQVNAEAEEAAQIAVLEAELDAQLRRMQPDSASDEVVLGTKPEAAGRPLAPPPPPPPPPSANDSEGDN